MIFTLYAHTINNKKKCDTKELKWRGKDRKQQIPISIDSKTNLE